MSTVLETKRLTLRLFTLDDVESMYLLGSIPEIVRYTESAPFSTTDDAINYLLNHPLHDYKNYGYGRFACILKENDQLIGFCGLKYVPETKETDLGYRFLPQYWNKGLATEAAKSVAAYARDVLKLKRLIGSVHRDNKASKNVLSKLGFDLENRIPVQCKNDINREIFAKAL